MSYVFNVKCKGVSYNKLMKYFKNNGIICCEEESERKKFDIENWSNEGFSFFKEEGSCRPIELNFYRDDELSVRIFTASSFTDFEFGLKIIIYLAENYKTRYSFNPIREEGNEKYSIQKFKEKFNHHWIKKCLDFDIKSTFEIASKSEIEIIGTRRSMYLGPITVEKFKKIAIEKNLDVGQVYYSHMARLQVIEEEGVYYSALWDYTRDPKLGKKSFTMLMEGYGVMIPPSDLVLIPNKNKEKYFFVYRDDLLKIFDDSNISYSLFDEKNLLIEKIDSMRNLIILDGLKIPLLK